MRGVAVLIRSGLDFVIQHKHCDSKGRLIMVNAKIKDENYVLINLKGLNKDAEAICFYHDLLTTLQGVDLDSDSNVMIHVGGDLNCPLDLIIDKKGGILIPRQHVINSIENIQNEFSLQAIWRIKNPNTRSYTWSKSSPFIFGRPDSGLILNKLNDLVTQVDIVASFKTDHSSILLELENIQESCKGAGFWKLNTSLLARPDYLNMINSELPNWLDEAKDLSDHRAKWDWLKFKIKTSSITYSKNLAQEQKARREA